MNKEEIIRKIRGLLELAANDPESNESKLAAEKAGILQAKYNIKYVEEDNATRHIITNEIPVYMKTNVTWSHYLITYIADAFDCRAVRGRSKQVVGDNAYCFAVIGYSHDVDLVMWFFRYLRTIISKRGEDRYKKMKERKSYQLGFTTAVGKRLKEMNRVKEQHTDEKTTALVVVKNKDVDKAYKEQFKNSRKSNYTPTIEKDSYLKGKSDGESVSLSRPMPSGRQADNKIAGKMALN